MATKKKDKDVVEVKEVYTDVFGYAGGKVEYAPAVFDKLNVAKEQRFTVDVEPMSDADCSVLRSINAKLRVDIALYNASHSKETQAILDAIDSKRQTAKDWNSFIESLTPEEISVFYSVEQHKQTLDNIAGKFSLVFPYVSNYSNGELTASMWASMNNQIREDIYNRIVDISNVNIGETINLS